MKRLLTTILLITMLTGCGASSNLPTKTSTTDETSSHSGNTENSDFLYRINKDDVTIISYEGNKRSIVLPSSIENYPVKTVQQVTLKDCVTELTYAEGITEITIPRGKSLKKVNLPSTLEIVHINKNFSYHKIAEVNISNNKSFISKDGVLFTADEKKLVYFPCGRTGSYSIPNGTEIVAEHAFREALIENITFPESIKEIEKYAFYLSELTTVDISEGVSEIGNYAFAETNLDEIVLPASLKTVGSNIFGYENERIAIYVNGPKESLEQLNNYKNLTYHNETTLEKATRQGKWMIENELTHSDLEISILTDIDGDDFPELLIRDSWGGTRLYAYTEKSGWQEFIIFYGGHSNINLYYDKENNSYFFVQMYESNWVYYCLYAEKITFNSNGERVEEMIGYSDVPYPNGSYVDSTGGFVFYNGINGFEIKEYIYGSNFINDWGEYHDFKKYIEKGLSDYELVKKIDFDEILNKYKSEATDNEGKTIISDGVFADKPNGSKYNFTTPPQKKIIFTIGEREYTQEDYAASLSNEEINPKNFKKLSQLPNLQTLSISTDGEADLTGIEKLQNLKCIYINADSIKGAQSLKQLTKVEWLDISAMENIDFLSDMDTVKVLEIPYTIAMPDDYFKPVYDMKSLKYIPVSVWEKTITDEQINALNTNRPDVTLCFYKI